jgi:hypothetical protein
METLDELRNPTSTTDGPSESALQAQQIAALAQQLSDTQRMLAISQAQLPVFNRWAGIAHGGMALPGTASDTYTVRAQGGEVISKPGSGTNIVVYLGDREVTDIVGVEIDGKLQKVAQRATPAGGVAGRRAAYK